ncbi:23S rRNA (adenine(2030)-N(6))-methyltransferase RlmJ [Terrihabitans soli]|uniref:23S rRNA (adenine(2030)-N(6))-methyltransferase RlmJ n=1 Tax=Terrihabitans soli TaxID=708113 RepID=UPI003B831A71
MDTHAGIGLYDLKADEAARTGEWQGGVGRLWDKVTDAALIEKLEPWRQAVEAVNPDGGLRFYPGSPELVRSLARPGDRLTLCELHPEDAAALRRRYRRDERVTAVEIDGYTALNAYLPPKERRGLVLIDPPFEEVGEFHRMTEGLKRAHKKWPTGIYALWYPIKDVLETEAFTRGLGKAGIPDMLAAELLIRRPNDKTRLNGCGLVIVNPPFKLKEELDILLPGLAGHLGEDAGARGRVVTLAAES